MVLVAVSIGGGSWWYRATPGSTSRSISSSVRPVGTSGSTTPTQIVVLSVRSYTGAIGDFRFVEGTLRSEAAVDLDRVDALCTWFDDDGAIVADESSAIDVPVLAPGQTANFRVMTRARDDLRRFTMSFRHRGVALTTRTIAPDEWQSEGGQIAN